LAVAMAAVPQIRAPCLTPALMHRCTRQMPCLACILVVQGSWGPCPARTVLGCLAPAAATPQPPLSNLPFHCSGSCISERGNVQGVARARWQAAASVHCSSRYCTIGGSVKLRSGSKAVCWHLHNEAGTRHLRHVHSLHLIASPACPASQLPHILA
jgi:hypothetical protein